MTTETPTRKTAAEYREELMLDCAARKNEIYSKIDHARSEAHSLRLKAAKDSSWTDHSSAQQALQQAGQNLENIRSWQKTIRDIDLEIEGICRGTDPRLISVIQGESSKYLHELQTEHAEALAHFNKLLAANGELCQTAQRLVTACTAMHYDIPVPPAALSILNLSTKGL